MSSDYVKVSLQAVKEAEKIILKYFDIGVRSEIKDDLSPVTVADRQAEEIIKKTILKKFPNHTFYGEEGEKVDLKNHKGFTWIIDPIDGTKAFIRKNPLFATQLALMRDGELILGVSNAPKLKELIYAEKGRGCFANGERVRASGIKDLSEAYLSHGSLKYFVKINKIDNLLNIAKRVKQSRGYGDFWSYQLIAQGKLEIMLESKVQFWDIAAMKVIIEEAGGIVTQLDGKPVDYTATTFLATNGNLHQETVELFSSA